MTCAAPYCPCGRKSCTGSTTNSVEQSVARSSSATRPPNSVEPPADEWRIWPSSKQVEVPRHKQTHTRPLPLPCTIDGWINGPSYRGQLAGHGTSKFVYRLTNRLLLKLCRERYQEPCLHKAVFFQGRVIRLRGLPVDSKPRRSRCNSKMVPDGPKLRRDQHQDGPMRNPKMAQTPQQLVNSKPNGQLRITQYKRLPYIPLLQSR